MSDNGVIDRAAIESAIRSAVAAARASGRGLLFEHEGFAIAAAAGIGVPQYRLFRSLAEFQRDALDEFSGDRVVIKVVAATVAHKSDRGGVRVVPRDVDAVADALRSMADAFADDRALGYLVEEFVPHDDGFGGELLVGVRCTPDFGPVVTIGPGGVHAEFLTRNLAPGHGVAILSPALTDSADIDRALERAAVVRFLTGSQRGMAPRVTHTTLRALVRRLLAIAAAAEHAGIADFEMNPVVFTARGPVALDALAHVGRAPGPLALPRPIDKIARLLHPRTIAIIGVSERMNPGRQMLENVLRAGFPHEQVFVIKPGAETIAGCRCVPDLASLPLPVDLFLVSVDARQAAVACEEAIRLHRAESIVLIPGGFGERDGSEASVDRLRALLAVSRAEPWRGPVINGANCLGVRSRPGHCNTLFIPTHKLDIGGAIEAPLAVLSQSGAFAVSWASELGALDPRFIVTFGNQLDLTVADWLEHLEGDPGVRVFACYVEGFQPGDGRRFAEVAARLTASGRTVLLYRAGRTRAGAAASASHTASVAGDFSVCRALVEAAGVVVADGLDEFTDLTRLFCRLGDRRVGDLRLGAMSNAGFECVAIADHAGEFRLSDFAPETRTRLVALLDAAKLGAIVGVRNPLDVTPILGDSAFADAAEAILDDPGVDAGLIGCVPLSGALTTLPAGSGHAEDIRDVDSVVTRLGRLAGHEKPWVAVVDAGPLFDPMARALDDAGVPTFRSADRALALFGRWCAWRIRYGASNPLIYPASTAAPAATARSDRSR